MLGLALLTMSSFSMTSVAILAIVLQAYSEKRNRAKVTFNLNSFANLTDVLFGGVLGANAEPDDESLVDGGGHHVQLPGGVDRGQQLLVQLVRPRKAEADEADLKKKSKCRSRSLSHFRHFKFTMTLLQTSKRLSERTNFSKCLASRQCSRM